LVHLVANGAGKRTLARDFAMKLRLAAVVLGCTTRKELAAAFRRVNPDTTFDVERADKWLSGKALPRAADVYRDWSKLLRLDRPLEWLASCSVDELVAILAKRDGVAPDLLLEGAPWPSPVPSGEFYRPSTYGSPLRLLPLHGPRQAAATGGPRKVKWEPMDAAGPEKRLRPVTVAPCWPPGER
jgi:hypothetical protein